MPAVGAGVGPAFQRARAGARNPAIQLSDTVSVPEGTAQAFQIALLRGVNPPAGATYITFTLTDHSGNQFQLGTPDGFSTPLETGAAPFDYEVENNPTFTVTGQFFDATDTEVGDLLEPPQFTINVTDVSVQPSTISDLAAEAIDHESVLLTYSAATNADSYEYRRSLAGLNDWTAAIELVADTVTGLELDTEYDFQVRGVSDDDDAIDADWSNTATATTAAGALPEAPLLQLDPDTDTGVVGDKITSNNEFILEAVSDDDFEIGDILSLYDASDDSLLASVEVESLENVAFGLDPAADGTKGYYLRRTNAAALQGPAGNTETVTVDTAAPELTDAVGTATNDTEADVTVDTDEDNGFAYWVVTESATPPTEAQVKAGQDHTGAAAVDSGSIEVEASGEQQDEADGLTAATAYYLHTMHEDLAGNQSDVETSPEFTTSINIATIDNIFGVYSNKLVIPAYSGPLIRLRRASDNAESDFNPDENGIVDAAAIATFISATTGHVTIWYDQTGNARNAFQPTSAVQPAINLSGSIPTVEFVSGLDQRLSVTPSTFSQNSAGISLVAVAKRDDTNISQALIAVNRGTTPGFRALLGATGSGTHRAGGQRIDADVFDGPTGLTADTDWHVHIGAFDWANADLFYRRDDETDDDLTFQTAGNSSDTASTTIRIGNNEGLTFDLDGQMTLVALISDVLTAQERQDLGEITLQPLIPV